MPSDSDKYIERKTFFNKLLTIYGRKPVLEALQEKDLPAYKLHLADSNKPASILSDILKLAERKGIEIQYHDKKALSRISKNGKQDQGIALDIHMPGFLDYRECLEKPPVAAEFIAVDSVTNPQNLGMIIRSVCASPFAGLIIPEKGCAKLDSLVIKASAGTLFKTPIIRCDTLPTCLSAFRQSGFDVLSLMVNAPTPLKDWRNTRGSVYVLGNETQGVSEAVQNQCNHAVSIPMNNGVESLNVAVTASLICFRNQV